METSRIIDTWTGQSQCNNTCVSIKKVLDLDCLEEIDKLDYKIENSGSIYSFYYKDIVIWIANVDLFMGNNIVDIELFSTINLMFKDFVWLFGSHKNVYLQNVWKLEKLFWIGFEEIMFKHIGKNFLKQLFVDLKLRWFRKVIFWTLIESKEFYCKILEWLKNEW